MSEKKLNEETKQEICRLILQTVAETVQEEGGNNIDFLDILIATTSSAFAISMIPNADVAECAQQVGDDIRDRILQAYEKNKENNNG